MKRNTSEVEKALGRLKKEVEETGEELSALWENKGQRPDGRGVGRAGEGGFNG